MPIHRRYLLISIAALLLTVEHSAPAWTQGMFPGQGSKSDWLRANGFFAEGNQHLQTKKYAVAESKFKQAITIYPGDYHYYLNLGLAQKKQGELADAAESFKKGTALNACDWRLWKGLANCLYQSGDMKAAEQAFRQALNSSPPERGRAELTQGIAACGRRAH
jgi:tetratricopeptide (TPR) repeat protein